VVEAVMMCKCGGGEGSTEAVPYPLGGGGRTSALPPPPWPQSGQPGLVYVVLSGPAGGAFTARLSSGTGVNPNAQRGGRGFDTLRCTRFERTREPQPQPQLMGRGRNMLSHALNWAGGSINVP